MTSTGDGPFPPMGRQRFGLRARSSASFGVGALVVASIMAILTLVIARSYLLSQREDGAVRQSYLNARLVRSALTEPGVDVAELLTSLQLEARSEVAVNVGGTWFSTSVAITADQIPASLRDLARSGVAGRQLVSLDGVPTLVSAVPIPSVGAVYYELFPLRELATTLRTLRAALGVSAVVAALGGTALGLIASRRVLRPLRDVAATAAVISHGSVDRRLSIERDPDLSPLTTSFNEMVDALQERIHREARFSSDVSHELRTPLAVMTSAMSIAERHHGELSEDMKDLVKVLSAQLDVFRALTTDLLEIARADAGSVDLHLEPVDPVTFANQLVASIPDDLVVRVYGEPGDIEADKRRLRQIFVNLVTNARRYGGGADQITVSAPDPTTVRFTVDDRGPGVPVGEREAVFGRFARGSTGAATPGGSGLGLALAREHAALHGGSMWVDDRPGGGARFILEIPASAEQ